MIEIKEANKKTDFKNTKIVQNGISGCGKKAMGKDRKTARRLYGSAFHNGERRVQRTYYKYAQ